MLTLEQIMVGIDSLPVDEYTNLRNYRFRILSGGSLAVKRPCEDFPGAMIIDLLHLFQPLVDQGGFPHPAPGHKAHHEEI